MLTMRALRCGNLWVTGIVTLLAIGLTAYAALAQSQKPHEAGPPSVSADRGPSAADRDEQKETKQPLLPEGTGINRVGYFKITGNRATFFSDKEEQYRGLENLALERITATAGAQPLPRAAATKRATSARLFRRRCLIVPLPPAGSESPKPTAP